MTVLSHVLEVATRDWGLPLARNVVKLVRRPVIRNERCRRLKGDEEQRLLEGCDAGHIPSLRTLATFSRETKAFAPVPPLSSPAALNATTFRASLTNCRDFDTRGLGAALHFGAPDLA